LTAYDYGFRIYNPAIARFLSVDPLARSYPWYTPYQFAGNKPTIAIDIDGLEDIELHMGVQQWTDPKLQNEAKSLAKTDPQALAAMQQSAYNTVLGELDAIVAKHFDPKHNLSPDWSGITKDVGEYFWNSTAKSSLGIWNSYYNYDDPGATQDDLSFKIDQDVKWLVNNHFYAATAGTEFYYKYINLINAAKDPNTKAALMNEREGLAKQRWQAILKAAQIGFIELFIAAAGLDGELRSGRISGSSYNTYGSLRFVRNISGEVEDLGPTLERIRTGGKFPHGNDGSVFRNSERLLPKKPKGYYREYVHPTSGINGPGKQRIVIGKGGEQYYTPDHYKTFIQIKKGG
jgi:hypothetical protein